MKQIKTINLGEVLTCSGVTLELVAFHGGNEKVHEWKGTFESGISFEVYVNVSEDNSFLKCPYDNCLQGILDISLFRILEEHLKLLYLYLPDGVL